MKISTQWLRDFVTLNPPLERIAEHLTMAGLEVKKILPTPDQKDILFEIEITTNRPDWLSHWGVAREIAAVENLPIKIPEVETPANRTLPPGWRLNLKELEGCPYYSAVYLEGVSVAPTPDFIRDRLAACGIRSIGLIVDITNYVLLETGQPLHAFDADLVLGKEIQIRRARADENFVAIDDSVLKLSAKDLVIADAEKPIALAGVMGGKNTEVSDRTRNVLLESAFFHPRWIRQTSHSFGLASESSYRFERRVDPEVVDFARDRAVTLIRKYAKPRFVSGVLKAGEAPGGFRGRIHLTLAEVEKKLGAEIKPSQISSLLTRLGLDVKQDSKDVFTVAIPSFRSDLTRPIDLIEELARLHGYDKIPETLPDCRPLGVTDNPVSVLEERTRQFFSGCGAYETVTFSLISDLGLDLVQDMPQVVSIVNPQNKELRWLRPALWPSLLSVIHRNSNLGCAGAAFYEVANVYRNHPGASYPQEDLTLGFVLFGHWREKSWLDEDRKAVFHDAKGMSESFLERVGASHASFDHCERSCFNPGISENISVESIPIGFLGEIHANLLKLWDLDFDVYYAEISLDKLLPFAKWQRPLQELPRFPAVDRDLSITVEETVKAGEVENEILSHGRGLIRAVQLFDLYRGGRIPKGFKNLSFRLTYQSLEKTLVSDEIQTLHCEIGQKIADKFKASFQ